MDLERELAHLLEESADRTPVPVRTMVAEAAERGRRLRLRRRLQTVGTVLAVAALVTGGALLGTVRRLPAPAVADAPPNSAAPSGGTPAATTPPPSASAAVPATERLRVLLAGVLPEGVALTPEREAVVTDQAVLFDVRYQDGHGAAYVGISIEALDPEGPAPDCAGRGGQRDRAPERCAAGASGLESASTYRYNAEVTGWEIVFQPREGAKVVIWSTNGTTAASGSAWTRTREQPPLSLAGWQRVAEDGCWQRIAEEWHLAAHG
ncbi:hypothetical protein [Kitasatospora camelliae]|uniref:Uncharacterized protein n=1 Tax=Kitasatospora camelliae TaxID=3156397 RepID=A0AAU8JW42_9ACTN